MKFNNSKWFLSAVLTLTLAVTVFPACEAKDVTVPGIGATKTVTVTASPANVQPTEANPIVVDPVNREVRIAGKVNGVAFTQPSWHIFVYTGGKAAASAPFLSYANPHFLYDALVYFGGVPGDNMPLTDYSSTFVKGSAVQIYVTWEGASKNYKLSEVTVNPGGAQGKDVAIKFGGNRDRIDSSGTGCLACYYSCPFGIVSNSSYNGDDSAAQAKAGQGGVLLNKTILPADGTPVVLTFKVTP